MKSLFRFIVISILIAASCTVSAQTSALQSIINAMFINHNNLNRKLWQHGKLRPKVRKYLLRIADAFYASLALKNIKLVDVGLGGSQVRYDYSSYSDIDLWPIIKISDEHCSKKIFNIITAAAAKWHSNHNIEIYGYRVEIYVKRAQKIRAVNGDYSVLQNKWIVKTKPEPRTVTKKKLLQAVKAYVLRGNKLQRLYAKSPIQFNCVYFANLLDELRDLRVTSLSKGELGLGNLTYKVLKYAGYRKTWRRLYYKCVDRQNSLSSVN